MASLFVDHLTVIDCSALSAERGLIGASYIVDIELQGPLDRQGMVLDFSKVKKQIKRLIDDSVDHRLLVPTKYVGLQIAYQGEQVALQFRDQRDFLWQHSSPAVALAQIPLTDISAELLSPWLQQHIQEQLPRGMKLTLRLREEQIDGASYCYSHGLQKHDGACQRIAHGHRSRIEIFIDGERSATWEQTWAKRFDDIYIVTRSHIHGEATDGETPMLLLRYRAQEGDYFLNLPKVRCHAIDTESTVEHIAAHIAEVTQRETGADKVRVRAFEGVLKGAIAEKCAG